MTDIVTDIKFTGELHHPELDRLRAENAKLRAALREYVDDCSICGGDGSLLEYDKIEECYLWRNCEACSDARAALGGDT